MIVWMLALVGLVCGVCALAMAVLAWRTIRRDDDLITPISRRALLDLRSEAERYSDFEAWRVDQ